MYIVKVITMDLSPIFLLKILQILASRYGMSCTLEELTSLLNPVFNSLPEFTGSIITEKGNQMRVLDALLLLSNHGYVFLNSTTDNSSITIKGLIKLDDKIFCN